VPQPKKPKRVASASKQNPLEQLFQHYLEESKKESMDVDEEETDCIGPSGIEKMCEETGVSLDDISLLIMAWHAGSLRAGYFSREEWMKLTNVGIHDMESLKRRLSQFKAEVMSNIDNVKRLYLFTFNYVREKAETKVIPIELAEGYIRLILPNSPHTAPFCTFLLQQRDEPKGYRAMNLDQWKMWWEFAHSVPVDLSTYDEAAAWPLIIDNYVIARKAILEANGMQTSS
jgi:hypothetical protein